MTNQKQAHLRTCASCEWIYKGANEDCPKCGFGSYGARFVYGDKCYQYAKTQKPWFDRKMGKCAIELLQQIDNPAVSAAGYENQSIQRSARLLGK